MARVANVRALVYSLVSMWYSMRIMSIDGLVTKLMGIGFGIFVKRSEANNEKYIRRWSERQECAQICHTICGQ